MLALSSLPSNLRALELKPMVMNDDGLLVRIMCRWLINTGRICHLRSLHLAMTDHMHMEDIEDLIRQPALTLTSLTLDCHQYQGLTPLPDLVLQPRLETLHLQNMECACFDAMSMLLLSLTCLLSWPVIILDISIFHAPASLAGVLWRAMERMASCPRFIVNVFFTKYAGWCESKSTEEQDVRACIPQTVMRGGLDLRVSVSYERPDDDDDGWYPSAFD